MKTSSASDLVIRAVETEEEVRLGNALMSAAHHEDPFEAIRWVETCGADYPEFRREHTRIALWNDEFVGALRVTSHTLRIGEARLRAGGFGWVATSPRHRNKGIARALVCQTMHYLREQNYHVSMHFGFPNFFQQFGFTTTLSDYEATVSALDAAETGHVSYKLRGGKPGDIRAIQKIHNANDGDTGCSPIRSAAHITNRWDLWKSVRVLTNGAGRLVAYFLPRLNGNALCIDEIGVLKGCYCPALLHACAQASLKAGDARVRFLAPPTHPFIQYLLGEGQPLECHVTDEPVGMMAFVNMEESLESMIPEWESLLQSSDAGGLRTEATLFVDGAPYRIRANRGAIDVAACAGANKTSFSATEFMHLLTGYRGYGEVFDPGRGVLKPGARSLLAVLFPRRIPYIWRVDRFWPAPL